MDAQSLDALKYPIGKFSMPKEFDDSLLANWIKTIEELPQRLKMEIEYLGKEELSYRYRPEGWTIRQVIHHLADSHMNSFIRFKLALTEDKPNIKPYFENLWAELPDGAEGQISHSVQLIEALHKRWVFLLRNMKPDDFNREFTNPEYKRVYKLFVATALYAWHCDHHLAHIKQAKQRKER